VGIVLPIWAMIAMVLSVSAILLNSFGSKSFIKAQRLKRKKKIDSLTYKLNQR
jgi:hypothetical protein